VLQRRPWISKVAAQCCVLPMTAGRAPRRRMNESASVFVRSSEPADTGSPGRPCAPGVVVTQACPPPPILAREPPRVRGRSVKGQPSDRERSPTRLRCASRWMLQAPDWRNQLLEVSGSHRMINGTIATGALCRRAAAGPAQLLRECPLIAHVT